jgi:hypothetical protein
MACPRVASGGDNLQMWREAVNILNKQGMVLWCVGRCKG